MLFILLTGLAGWVWYGIIKRRLPDHYHQFIFLFGKYCDYFFYHSLSEKITCFCYKVYNQKWHSFFITVIMRRSISPDTIEKVKAELGELERYFVKIDGKQLKPSQCYRFNADPLHVLFNTNCPESLKQKIQSIISKYAGDDERD